ncbi:MAG: conjugal transfer protein TraR [Deltaproteobacteria bacterium SM23_61]|nr:MAG: conjugal transfer protein TraR [Deltaproteobacteria bacterium SM23_61]
MDKERLEIFRELLNERLKTILEEAEKTVKGMTNDRDSFPDPTDRANLESDRNFLLRMRDRERKLIGKIKEALARIDDGTFGICEECGEDISEERLKARPMATLCIGCKTKAEEEEKQKEKASAT